MQLAKGLQTPYFEDGDNWADFAWNWGRYWNALTRGGVEVGDEEKLEIFDSCLSAKLRHMTKYLYKGTEKLLLSMFSPFWSNEMDRKRPNRVSMFGKMCPSPSRASSP